MRRRQQGRRKAKKTQARIESQLNSSEGCYKPPDRADCRFRQWHIPFDDANSVRTQVNSWRSGATLVDFVMTIQRLTTVGWEDVERFDCCHGHCHLHPDGRQAAQPIYQIDTADDVAEAFSRASAVATERARIIRNKERG